MGKDSKLTFKCMECDQSYDKSFNEDSKYLKTHTDSVMETSMISVSHYEKAFIRMNTWIFRTDSMKHYFAHTQKNKFYCNLKTENMSDLD